MNDNKVFARQLEKICSKCKKKKSIDDFYKHDTGKDGHRGICKSCTGKIRKLYTERPGVKERIKIYHKQHFQKNKKKIMIERKKYLENPIKKAQFNKSRINWGLMKRLGITSKDKEQMIKDQNGLCAICNTAFISSRRTHVDHDAKTMKVRKILCDKCNHLIGLAHESIAILKSAINYLDKYK